VGTSFEESVTPDPGTRLRGYVLSVAVVLLALGLRLLLAPVVGGVAPFFLFTSAVIVASWCGGLGPGLLSTALAGVLIVYFFIEPVGSFLITHLGLGLRLGEFLAEGSLISLLMAQLRASRRRAERGAHDACGHREALRCAHDKLEVVNASLRQEIAEREHAEDALVRQATILQSILDNMADGVVVVDQDERFMAFNPAAERIFGHGATSASSAEWPDHYGLYRTDRVTPFAAHELPLIRAVRGEGVSDQEIFVRHAGALEGRWIVVRGRPLREEDGRTVGGVVVCHDVTERKRAEQELVHQARELARSNAELEQFAYVASHDLQEPLRMVGSFTELLARRYRGQIDEKADRYIGFVVDGVARMQQQIQALLSYSRAGTGGTAHRPTDCEEVLRRTLVDLRPTIDAAGARVDHEPLPTVPALATQVGQVFQNLIANAIKFRGAGPPEVHVSARRDANDWVFCIRDNGIGIDPQFADQIFIIFQRLHGRDEYPGTGIGLAICKKIVERHGGRIWVESRPGAGARFFFTLPTTGEGLP
jgi:PAS domain S-box-containing protein